MRDQVLTGAGLEDGGLDQLDQWSADNRLTHAEIVSVTGALLVIAFLSSCVFLTLLFEAIGRFGRRLDTSIGHSIRPNTVRLLVIRLVTSLKGGLAKFYARLRSARTPVKHD